MKRFHVHVGVKDLNQSIDFYSALFGATPSVTQDDYAKWMLDDPRINFAISTRSGKAGLDHLGLQVESACELPQVESQLRQASPEVVAETGATCCYAEGDKHWVEDPSGIAWEAFHTLQSIPVFGMPPKGLDIPVQAACCAPSNSKSSCC